MTRETSKSIARLAGRVLQGHKPTRKEIESLAASALAQAEIEAESVKRWMAYEDGEFGLVASQNRAYWGKAPGVVIVPVLIRPARADKRTHKRKRK